MVRWFAAVLLATSAVVAADVGVAHADACGSYAGPVLGQDAHVSTTGTVGAYETAGLGVTGALGKSFDVVVTATNAVSGGIQLAVVGDETEPWVSYSTFFANAVTTPESPYATLCFEVRNLGSRTMAYELAVTETTAGSGECTEVAGFVACATLTAGEQVRSYSVPSVTVTPGTEHTVAGSIDLYRFELPNGGVVTVPCVVLAADATGADPCADAGGTFFRRETVLLDQSAREPVPGTGPPLVTVRVCAADLVVTVNDIGINSFPAFTVC